MLLDHCRWGSLYERLVLQFCFNGSRFLFDPGNFLVQPVAFARLVTRGDREKKFAERRDRNRSSSRSPRYLGSSVNSSAFNNRRRVGICSEIDLSSVRKINRIFLFDGNFDSDLKIATRLNRFING